MLTECPYWCAGADFEVVPSRASLDENQIGMLFNVCSAHIALRCAAPLAAPCGGAGFCAPVCGGAIGLPDVGGDPALQEGRASMVQGKGGEGGTGGARFELGPAPRTPLRPPTTAHTLGSRPTPRMTHDEPAPGIDRGTGECAPCSWAVHGVNATRVVSYTCSPLRARV